MALETQRLFRFGPYRLDAERRLLLRGSETVPLRPRVFDTLALLAENLGQIVSKDQLLEAVWPDAVVEENNLNQNILALRRALETQGGAVRIETVPRRGYRLLASPAEEQPEPSSPGNDPAAGVATLPETRTAAADVRSRRLFGPAAALVITAALLTGWIWKVNHAARPISGVRSLAVLPLQTLGAAAAEDYLGIGIADAVITRLGYVRSISVRPTASVRSLHGKDLEPVAAGRALHVDAVLDGQIQKAGGRLRVTAQLVGVRDGAELWSDQFDVKATDLFTIEDAISGAVARALADSLSAGEALRVGRERRTTPEAYEAYLKGRYFWNQRLPTSTEKARKFFQEAIALDPNYALAYAGLADSYNFAGLAGREPLRARQAAKKALALDDSLAEAYAALGNTSLFADWNFGDAERSFRRALELNPSYATAHQWYAYCFLTRGDVAGASAEIRRARDSDPLSPSIGVDAGLMSYYEGRYDDAIAIYRQVLSLDPSFVQARQALPSALLEKGDREGARRECASASAADAELEASCLAILAARAGAHSEAEARLRAMTGSERWWTDAIVALELGNRGAAVTLLESALPRHSASLLLIGAEPLFEGLRGEPRFADLMHRIGIRPVERAPR